MCRRIVLCTLAGLFLGALAENAGAATSAVERKALRRATGHYGCVKGSPIPDGTFKGRVKNQYNEHSDLKLKARPGKRNSMAVLNVWNGSNHKTTFVRITAKVRSNGNVVRLSGGSVKGKGLLPYGIQVRSGSLSGSVDVKSKKPEMANKFQLAGVDLSAGNAKVKGTAKFKGEQN